MEFSDYWMLESALSAFAWQRREAQAFNQTSSASLRLAKGLAFA
jgi:hypothetical protein